MAEIEQQIVNFLLTEKTEVLRQALARQTGDILAGVQGRLELSLRSLQMPLAELDQRARLFEENLGRIEDQRIVTMARLRAEEARLAAAIRKRADDLLPKSVRFLRGVVQRCQDQHGTEWTEDLAREAIAEAIPGFFEREFGAAHQLCEQELREALLPHGCRVRELIASVHQLVTKLFDVPFELRQQEIALERANQPYWRTHRWRFPGPGAIPPSWIDRVLPRGLRHARIRRRIMEQVEYLLTRNIGDLQESTLQDLAQSVEHFGKMLNDGLQQAIQTTRRAIDAARRQRTEHSTTVAPEIMRLESAVAGLQALREHLAHRR
jgi:hypothetical protein